MPGDALAKWSLRYPVPSAGRNDRPGAPATGPSNGYEPQPAELMDLDDDAGHERTREPCAAAEHLMSSRWFQATWA